MEYIHYGITAFDPSAFTQAKNHMFMTKPDGGFWASRADASFGWKQWCKAEDFREIQEDVSYRFTLSDSANVVRISSLRDMESLPKVEKDPYEFFPNRIYLDFEEMQRQGVDAVELCWFGEEHNGEDDLQSVLYAWDCDSIVILNPAIIVS